MNIVVKVIVLAILGLTLYFLFTRKETYETLAVYGDCSGACENYSLGNLYGACDKTNYIIEANYPLCGRSENRL